MQDFVRSEGGASTSFGIPLGGVAAAEPQGMLLSSRCLGK